MKGIEILVFLVVLSSAISAYIIGNWLGPGMDRVIRQGLLILLMLADQDGNQPLRVEIREILSKQLLESIEQGTPLTEQALQQRCPKAFRQGDARIIWVEESARMVAFFLQDE